MTNQLRFHLERLMLRGLGFRLLIAMGDGTLEAGRRAGADFDVFMGGLRDQITYLGYDLNPGGIASLAEDAERLNARADSMFARIDEAVAAEPRDAGRRAHRRRVPVGGRAALGLGGSVAAVLLILSRMKLTPPWYIRSAMILSCQKWNSSLTGNR